MGKTKGEERIGEKRVMKCGIACTIVAYHSSTNIDVLFDTGELIFGKRYSHFLEGSISNKGGQAVNHKKTEADRQKRLGEKKMMNCGLEGEITEYFNRNNITVTLSDGCIMKDRTYQQFLQGEICSENIDRQWANRKLQQECKKKYEGLTLEMKCGLKATIKEYINSLNIVVEFENGTIVKNATVCSFQKREILPYNRCRTEGYNAIKTIETQQDKNSFDATIRLGEKRTMKDGYSCIVKDYQSSKNITLEYDDGTLLYNQKYKKFIDGEIKKPISRIGETNIMNNGQLSEIIEYKTSQDVTIKYEDGTIVKHIEYQHFQDGSAANPNYKVHNTMSIQEFALLYYLRNYGFIKIKPGDWKNAPLGNYELDFYNHEKKIAIEYDGEVHDIKGGLDKDNEKNRRCKEMNVLLYRFRSPRLTSRCNDLSINYILDKQKRMKPYDIIDCKVELEEIFTKHGIQFYKDDIDFKRDLNKIIEEYRRTHVNAHAKERVGEKVYNERERQYMEIIEYFDCKHMTVKFESGEIVHNVQYNQFHRGTLLKPKIKNIV